MEKHTLKNKITIYYYPIDNAYSTAVGLYVNSGSSAEPSNKNGMAHLLEHLHFRRLEDLPQKELYSEMDKMGTTLRASTHKDIIRFYLKVRPEFFNRAIKLFRKLITMYDWTEDDFELEKRIVYNELVSREAYVYTEPMMDSLVWGNNPLAMPIIGTKDTIVDLRLDDIIKYKQHSFSAENLALVITGNITDDMKQTLKNEFEDIVLMPIKHKKRYYVNDVQNSLTMKFISYKWDYVDVKLAFKLKGKPNLYELIVLNSILGGGTGSKLQGVLREKLTLTTDIYSFVESYEEGSNIQISFTTHKSNVCKCIKEIVAILNRLKIEITDEDMDTNLPYFTENLWFWLEDTELLNKEIGWDVFKTNTPLDIEERILRYKSVTKENLMTLSKKMFTMDNTVLLIAGDVNHICKSTIKNIISVLGTQEQ